MLIAIPLPIKSIEYANCMNDVAGIIMVGVAATAFCLLADLLTRMVGEP